MEFVAQTKAHTNINIKCSWNEDSKQIDELVWWEMTNSSTE
jgi:hypothetical protein